MKNNINVITILITAIWFFWAAIQFLRMKKVLWNSSNISKKQRRKVAKEYFLRILISLLIYSIVMLCAIQFALN